MMASKMNEKGSRYKGERFDGEHPYGDKGQMVCLAVFLIVWSLDSFVFKTTTILTDSIPLTIRLTAGGLVFILAAYFIEKGHRIISHDALSDKGLVKDGAFARLRHPLYGGSLLFYLSLFLATFSLAALVVWCLVAVFYNAIAGYEEKLLLEKYGDEYREYQREVPRWLPRLRPARLA
jgi:protein-S-isoprenylcysteine O-methyltransferase Ste14